MKKLPEEHTSGRTHFISLRSKSKAMASSPVFFRMGLLPPPPPDAPLRSSEAQEKLLYYPPSPPLPHSRRLPVSRRDVILTISALPLSFTALPLLSHARERRGRKAIPPEEYMTSRELSFLHLLLLCTIFFVDQSG